MNQVKKTTYFSLPAFFLFVLLLRTPCAWCAGERTINDARSLSLSNASVMLSGATSLFNNPSLFAFNAKRLLLLGYQNPFGIENYHELSLGLGLPTRGGNFSTTCFQSGIPNCHESVVSMAYSHILGAHCSSSVGFNWFFMDFPEEGRSKGVLFPELAFSYLLEKVVCVGIVCKNPMSASLSTRYRSIHLPTVVRAGAAFSLGSYSQLLFEAACQSEQKVQLRLGFETEISSRFYLRGGMAGLPVNYSAGIGYWWKFLHTDLAIVHHPIVGYTSAISFSCSL